ncbi:MAG: gluconokinase [Steroidobacteraceae bacterium]
MTALVVMGPSGCGKTTLGLALAEALGWTYVDGDALHPPQNIAKMRAGGALDDADRAPFLDNVARSIASSAGIGIVLSCSALKRAYRDAIRDNADRPVCFVLPVVSREVLHTRVSERGGHFMPASLVDSQLEDLEPLGDDEDAIVVSGNVTTEAQVRRVLAALESRL